MSAVRAIRGLARGRRATALLPFSPEREQSGGARFEPSVQVSGGWRCAWEKLERRKDDVGEGSTLLARVSGWAF